MDPLTIVLGLGNPGVRYRDTRHNLGFRVVDLLAERRGACFRAEGELARKVWTAEVPARGGRLVLAKSRTYMNRSGRAAAALCQYYSAAPAQLLVVYDDADLELGRIRVRPQGRAGGHNGIRSLIEGLQSEEFPRVRLGVRGANRERQELSDYVLGPFEPDERPVAEALVEIGVRAVEAVLEHGVSAAMNRVNALTAVPGGAEDAEPRGGRPDTEKQEQR